MLRPSEKSNMVKKLEAFAGFVDDRLAAYQRELKDRIADGSINAASEAGLQLTCFRDVRKTFDAANLLLAARELEERLVPEGCDSVQWMKNSITCLILPQIGGGGVVWMCRRVSDQWRVAKGTAGSIGEATAQVLDEAKRTKWWTETAAAQPTDDDQPPATIICPQCKKPITTVYREAPVRVYDPYPVTAAGACLNVTTVGIPVHEEMDQDDGDPLNYLTTCCKCDVSELFTCDGEFAEEGDTP